MSDRVRHAATGGRAIGRQSLFESHLRKLPLTRVVMKNVVESDEDFAIRRVQRAADLLRRRQGAFQRWELVRAAGLTRWSQAWPNVVRAIEYEVRPVASVNIVQDKEPLPPRLLAGPRKSRIRLRPLAVVGSPP